MGREVEGRLGFFTQKNDGHFFFKKKRYFVREKMGDFFMTDKDNEGTATSL